MVLRRHARIYAVMAIKPAVFNISISRDSERRRLDAEIASRNRGVSSGRQLFVIEGASVTLKAIVARTGWEGREVQRRYSTIIRKRAATWEDFA